MKIFSLVRKQTSDLCKIYYANGRVEMSWTNKIKSKVIVCHGNELMFKILSFRWEIKSGIALEK